MEAVPRKLVLTVALALVALAGLGAYQGYRRSSLGDPEAADTGLPSLTAPGAAGAKTASAVTDPSTQALNEAQVREIARQEARAALGQTKTTPVPDASEGDEASAAGAAKPPIGGVPATTTPPRPAPGQPALQTPAAPGAAPGESGQPSLF